MNKKGNKKEKKEEILDILKEENEISGAEEEKEPSVEQIKKEKNIFKSTIFVMCGFILFFFAVYFVIYSSKNFDYDGVKLNMIKEGQLTFYRTIMPVTNYQGKVIDYNFYIRSNPISLKNIPFNGRPIIKKDMVINATNELNCDGDGVIAVANMVKLYNLIGTKVVKDETVGCDPLGRYMFLRLLPGNKTHIEQVGLTCYDIYVNNCEILKGTEKFMLETFVELNKKSKR